jgi:hypothetical protein
MNDQRKENRKKIMSFTPVFDSKTFNPIGYIGDLTMLGALVIGEKPLEVDTKTTFVIDFPETPDFPARRVKIAARVVWNKHYPDKQYYGSGIEFHKISDENRTILESILARYQYRR